MKIIAIIQARMGSSRFPGKVLKDICGRTILERIVERLSFSKKIDRVYIATSETPADDKVEELCREKNIGIFRGSENDVLDRFYQAAKHFGVADGDAIARITGDCPLLDPNIVDNVIDLFLKNDFDYAANVNPPTFPDGLDIEVMKFSALEKSWKIANLLSEREHVTWHIRTHPDDFLIGNLFSDIDYSKLRWTLDEPEDFEVIETIYKNFDKGNKIFFMEDILKFLDENKEIQEKNKKFVRDEGLAKSLANDGIIVE